MYKRILVPTDGSDITAIAVQTAISLAKVTGAELMAICVKEPFPYSAISEMQPVPPQEFYDAQERIAAARASRPWSMPQPRPAWPAPVSPSKPCTRGKRSSTMPRHSNAISS